MEINLLILADIRHHLDAREMTILIGARQVGKTTILKALQNELVSQGQAVLFFNLDIEADSQYFRSQNTLLDKIRLEWGNKGGFVFVDEIQRKTNAGLFLKGLYDMELPYKWIVTGSGTLELKENIHESLVGRKRMFEVGPVSFREYIGYRTQYRYQDRLKIFLNIETPQVLGYLKEYLNYGGYPRVVTQSSLQEKRLILGEIFQSYIEKDLVYLLNLERPEAFSQMIRLLAVQSGQILNYSNLSRQTALAVPTLKKYLWYAEKTFIIHRLTPFFCNTSKELTKSPQVYFNDLGLRNFAINELGNIDEPHKAGFVFQNFIFQLLRAYIGKQGGSLHYWRTTGKAEVDFVIDTGMINIPVEVKYKEWDHPTISRSFRSFIDKYTPSKAYVVNLSLEKAIQIGKTKIFFIPYYQLIDTEELQLL